MIGRVVRLQENPASAPCKGEARPVTSNLFNCIITPSSLLVLSVTEDTVTEQVAEGPEADANTAQPHPSQGEMPFAMVYGEAVTELPKDLYIPPEALEVILEAFEGPLDLLLYLIKRQNIDILEINVAEITRQYMAYIDPDGRHAF